jgi:hypothetical protein
MIMYIVNAIGLIGIGLMCFSFVMQMVKKNK